MTDTTFDTDQPRKFSVKMKEGGKVDVSLDDHPIQELLTGISIDLKAGQPVADVMVTLSHRATQATEFEGLARVAVGAVDPGPAAAAFLTAIDAEELENAALNRTDLGADQHALTKAMLLQLTEWAYGRP